jgi:hypothetical protein
MKALYRPQAPMPLSFPKSVISESPSEQRPASNGRVAGEQRGWAIFLRCLRPHLSYAVLAER